MTEEASGRHVPGEKELRAFEAEFLRAHGPIPPLDACPIGWQPGALTPVFYGFRDYGQTQGAPGNVRVFFPSLDGSPQDAGMLQGCGRYPVVLFAHGDCEGDPDHYLKWFLLPAQLARGGYVVIVPQLPNVTSGVHPSEDQVTQDLLAATLAWIRQGWEFRQSLLPAPATGLAGHSYGALHAGILATKINVAGVASLSGVWIDWPDGAGPRPILQLQIPQLFTWGTEPFSEVNAQLGNLWDPIAKPKHRAIFTDAQHFDYLYTPQLPCRQDKGPCRWLGSAAADLVTMFFGKYLPPELWPNLPDLVPETLIPPPLTLTLEQQFFVGGYLIGMELFNADGQCHVTVTHELSTDRTVPFVLNTPQSVAAKAVQERDLVPVFIPPRPGGPASKRILSVQSQAPDPGTTVPAGSQVQMKLQAIITP
jgi:Alpha/beta hydrolase family